MELSLIPTSRAISRMETPLKPLCEKRSMDTLNIFSLVDVPDFASFFGDLFEVSLVMFDLHTHLLAIFLFNSERSFASYLEVIVYDI